MLFDRQSRRIFPALMVVASVTIVAGCQSTMLQPVATAAKSKHLDAAKSGPAIPDASKDLGRSSERTQFPPVSGLAESSPAISPADNAIGVTGDLSTLPRTDNPDPLVVKDATTAQVARNVLITEDPEFRSPPANTPGSATPLLDAAIRRAEQEEREMAMALTAPEPEKLEPSPRPTVAKIPVASPSEKPNPESKPILPMDSVPVASAGPVALNPIEAPESEKPKPGQAELRVPPTAPEPSRTTRDPVSYTHLTLPTNSRV